MQAPSTSNKCTAVYAYQAQHSNELSFDAGDIIGDVVRHEDGWWSGMVHGQLGVFPSTYVEALVDYGGGAGGAGGAGGEGGGVEDGGNGEFPPTEMYVRANYDYAARTGNELGVKKGDVFLVNEKDAEGKWWHGVYAGEVVRKGWFPAAYVSEISDQEAEIALQALAGPPPQQQQSHGGAGAGVGGRPATIPIQQPRPIVGGGAGGGAGAGAAVRVGGGAGAAGGGGGVAVQRGPAPAMKAMKREKAAKGLAGYVEVQILSARGLPADAKQSQVHVGIKDEKGRVRKVWKTDAAKKNTDPYYMESFQVNIADPEESDLNLSVMDGKRNLGEINVPLRSTKRPALEVAGGQDKEWKLSGDGGYLHLIVQYRDVNVPSRPKNFTKDESISLDTETGGFDLSAAGASWVRKFQEAGLEVGNRPDQRAPQSQPPRPQGAKPPPPLPPRGM